MTNNAVHFVIDASVTAALFINDIYTLKVRQLFDQFSLNISSVFYAPDAMYYEVLGVLRKHTLRFGYTTQSHDINLLYQIPFEITPTRDLMISSATISEQYNLSSYDAIYLALSIKLNVPLLTADQRLQRGVQGKPFNVKFIGDVI